VDPDQNRRHAGLPIHSAGLLLCQGRLVSHLLVRTISTDNANLTLTWISTPDLPSQMQVPTPRFISKWSCSLALSYNPTYYLSPTESHLNRRHDKGAVSHTGCCPWGHGLKARAQLKDGDFPCHRVSLVVEQRSRTFLQFRTQN